MELAICVVGGLLIAAMGVCQVVSGSPRLLHSYHYATTPPAELPALARETGAGLIGCGIGVALLALSSWSVWCAAVGTVLMVGSVGATLFSIVRHNGGLITGADVGFLATKPPAARMAICAVAGAALSLFGFVPGIYMITTGDVSSLHSYHTQGIAAADLPSFALCEGLCLMGLGVAIFVSVLAAAGMVGRPFKWWAVVLAIVGLVLFCASLIGLLLFIPYFGGSLTP